MRKPRLGGLWHHRDFVHLWVGETVSVFGTLIGRLALTFTAILWLDATALEVAVLGICEMAPGFVFGIAAGVWVDRLPRRAVMVWSDLGRFAILVTVPLAALADVLTIWQVFAVAVARTTLDAFFETAYRAYLPGLVGADRVLEGNSKLSATESMAEVGGFGVAGWLVQLFTAPGAVLVDALSFLVSAFAVARIRAPEPPPGDGTPDAGFLRSAREGVVAVVRDPLLRALAVTLLAFRLPMGIFAAIFVLFVTRELDLSPGVQGTVYAIGGVTSLAGATLAARSGAWHLGRSMVVASACRSLGALLPAFAAGPPAARVSLLAAQQFVTDPAWTYYEIQDMSIRQASTPPAVLGRVTATFRAAEFGAALVGFGLGGILGETLGLRETLVLSAVAGLPSIAWFAASPLARLRSLPAARVGD